MKKIGREVLFITKQDGNPRNGEGAFIRLKDGAIMFGYTEYIGTGGGDHDNARITCIISRDEGESWSDKRVMLDTPPNCKNIMSLSFLRMANGDIGAFYILKELDGTDKIMFVRSADEGFTWSEPLDCFACLGYEDYFVLNNDRVIRLKSGRILFSVASYPAGKLFFFYSDDDGYTWQNSDTVIESPISGISLQEPGLYQLPDGRIWCYIRCALGCQCQTFSSDDGITWEDITLNKFFTSPLSPMLVKDVGEYTAAIFNPIPKYTTRPSSEPLGRTPYVCAISDDRGVTFASRRLFYLEDDLTHGYCYPAIIEGDGYFLAAYYYSDLEGRVLTNQKIVKVTFDEIAKE